MPIYIFPTILPRAAAKIILNVRFSDDKTEDPVSVVEESLADDGVTIIHGETKTVSFQERLRDYDKMKVGVARWKYVNFPVTTTDFADGVLPAGVELTQRTSSSALNPYRVFGETTTENGITSIPVTVEYGIGTYCYSIDWKSPANAVDEAPAILLSIAYYAPQGLTKFTDNPTYSNTDYTVNYYRIPIVDEETITKIERNHIYRIDAVITGYGSTSENLPETAKDVKLKYHVLEWNEKESAESNGYLISVQTSTQYFLVTDRSEIEMYGPLGGGSRQEDVKLYYPQNTEEVEFRVKAEIVSQTGNTAAAISASPHYYDKNGDAARVPATYTPTLNNGYITGGSGSASRVTSPVMAEPYNATKYWTVRYTLEKRQKSGNNWGDWESTNISRDVTFKHYPVDNIQNFTGSWSSRWDGVDPVSTITYYTYNVYTYYRKKYSRTVNNWEPVSRTQWSNGRGSSNDARKNANSPETAINGYYATGNGGSTTRESDRENNSPVTTRPITITWSGNNYYNVSIVGYGDNGNGTRTFTINNSGYDYVSNYENFTYLVLWTHGRAYLNKYSNYYHLEPVTSYSYDPSASGWAANEEYDYEWEECTQAEYEASSADNRKFETEEVTTTYRPAGVTEYTSETITTTGTASTGNWVDWDTDANQTLNPRKYTADANQSPWYTYPVGSNSRVATNANMTNLDNNHMYVIQLTATSDEYALGKPILDANSQSKDHVVSPAFMLASQLGATLTPNDGVAAARHCATYMEVGTKDEHGEQGKRFTGWRLPTREEIGIIIKYQDALETMASVLKGDHYWTLEGVAVQTNHDEDQNLHEDWGNRYKYTRYDATTGAVRCVRDLDPDDLESLNSRK